MVLPEDEGPAINMNFLSRFCQLGPEDVLVIEGIHGLNDRLLATLPKETVYVIQIDMRASAEPEQLCLVVHSIPGKFGNGCIRMQRIFLNLDICLTQAPHPERCHF